MLNMQNVKDIEITEGSVRSIHDQDDKLIWGRLTYDTKYAGDTEQQTYTGKNLFDISKVLSNDGNTSKVINNGDGTLFIQTPPASSSVTALSPNKLSDYCPTLQVGDTVTLSFNTTGTNNYIYLCGTGANILWSTNASSRTQIITQAMLDAQVLFYASGINTTATVSNFQIEIGSTPTDYEPYVGGIPSPNPDYPQDVNVVTGTQTVTLSDGVDSEDYTISLGTVELCKIGNYQDYIYKSGDNWYVHKSTGKILLDGTETWGGTSGKYSYSDATIVAQPLGADVAPIAFSNYLAASNYTAVVDNLADNIIAGYYNGGQFRTRVTSYATANDWKTWLTSHNLIVYYALATPTDTQITDTTLIEQLDAIHQFLTRYGYNSNVSGNLPIIINKTNL